MARTVSSEDAAGGFDFDGAAVRAIGRHGRLHVRLTEFIEHDDVRARRQRFRELREGFDFNLDREAG